MHTIEDDVANYSAKLANKDGVVVDDVILFVVGVGHISVFLYNFLLVNQIVCNRGLFLMKDTKNSRSKRSLMVINLVETPTGYSVIEGT